MHLSLSAIAQFFRKRPSLVHRSQPVENPHLKNTQPLEGTDPTSLYGPFAHIVEQPTEDNIVHFFYQLLHIEDELSKNPEHETSILTRYGIQDHAHFSMIQTHCYQAFASSPFFHEAIDTAQVRFGRDVLERAAQSKTAEMEPIFGIDVTTYARILAALSASVSDVNQQEKILSSFGLGMEDWKTIDQGFKERLLQSPSHSIQSVALLWKYATALSPKEHPIQDHEVHPSTASDDRAPCSLETYAKLLGALSAWEQQGYEPKERFASTFQLSIETLDQYRVFWEAMLTKNPSLLNEYSALKKKYTALFLTGQDKNHQEL